MDLIHFELFNTRNIVFSVYSPSTYCHPHANSIQNALSFFSKKFNELRQRRSHETHLVSFSRLTKAKRGKKYVSEKEIDDLQELGLPNESRKANFTDTSLFVTLFTRYPLYTTKTSGDIYFEILGNNNGTLFTEWNLRRGTFFHS